MADAAKSGKKSIAVFGDGKPSVMAVEDLSRQILIAIQPVAGSSDPFPDTFIMNFESSDKADYQLGKSMSNVFLFNSFGHSITHITVSGFQASGIVMDDKGTTNSQDNLETYYRNHCISSDKPTLFKISIGEPSTTGSGTGAIKKPTIYHAYMVAFTRKPMGEAKVNGYAFGISFVGAPAVQKVSKS